MRSAAAVRTGPGHAREPLLQGLDVALCMLLPLRLRICSAQPDTSCQCL